MPYVEVWVDEADISDEVENAINDALKFIASGDTTAATNALAEFGSSPEAMSIKKANEREKEYRSLYEKWLKEPLPRPCFAGFAHRKRKKTAGSI